MIIFYVLILSFPLIEHPFFGSNVMGYTVEKYVGAACLLYAIIYATRRRQWIASLRSGIVYAFVAFYLVSLSSWCTVSGARAAPELIRAYTSHLLFLIICIILLDSESRIRWTLLASVSAIALASLYCLREWQRGVAVYGSGYRPGYVTGDPNYFTASALLCFPLMLWFMTEWKNRWERVYAAACLLVTGLAIVVAASRGGFLGLIATTLFLVWRSQRRARNFAVLGIAAVVLLALVPISPMERLLHPDHGDTESSNNRLTLWNAGLKMVAQNPFMGIGLGNFKSVLPAYLPPGSDVSFMAHNTYLEVTAETGVTGLFALLAILVTSYISLERTRRSARHRGDRLLYGLANALQAGLLGFAVSIFFLSAEFLKMFWFMVFLSACLSRVMPKSAKRVHAELNDYEVSHA